MTAGIRGLGGLFLGMAAYFIAKHIGITGWELFAVTMLVAFGALMVATGRLKDW